ncbi:MAG TPA: hypothetical protein VGH51_19500 [Candidatus Angelobacter sp.]|jgi:hypothetical protein
MASNTKRMIYIRLAGEGTDVFRPTEALDLGGGLFKVLAPPDYDPEDEKWEFPPGSVVECEKAQSAKGEYLRATKRHK